MKKEITLKDVTQIKALADPLRMQVLEAFCHKPMTTKQVATLLEVNPTRLYHHVEILEKAGLIKLVKTQQNRGTVEKYYSGVARRIAISHEFSEDTSDERGHAKELHKALTTALEATLSEIRKSVAEKLIKKEEPGQSAMVARGHIVTTREKGQELFDKIAELLKECHKYANKQGDITYGLTVAFYPVKKNRKASPPGSNKTE